MQVRRRLNLQVGEYDWQSLAGFIRLFVLGLGLILAIGVFGCTRLDGIDIRDIADQYRKSVWFLAYLPNIFLYPIAAIFNGHSIRYMLAPLFAMIFVLYSGAKFVQDIYALPQLSDGLRYVIASMFGMNYPVLVIDKGQKQVGKNEVNLIEEVGGPGYVIIEPGNAATLRKLREPGDAKISETYFLAPFETVGSAVNLDEQQGYKEVMSATTRDGIKVNLKDIHYRYRIKQQTDKNGAPVRRSLTRPYPFSPDAIRDMTYNLNVASAGLETWAASVERVVTGAISDFVIEHTLDYVTAPRTDEYNPRLLMRNQLFMEGVRTGLANLGAELLWVDVGHVEIEDESVDELRTTLWSADWAGDAAEVRAYGDAIRQAYHELGRAEAQADLIMSIAGALSDAGASQDSPENIRKILLARTAQILNTMTRDATRGRG